jgi:hypothetical protein
MRGVRVVARIPFGSIPSSLPRLRRIISPLLWLRSTPPHSVLQSRSEGGTHMAGVSSIVAQLKVERDRVERQLTGLNAALTAFAGVYSGGKPVRKRRKMSAKSRAKIAAAQRRRWAKFRARKK